MSNTDTQIKTDTTPVTDNPKPVRTGRYQVGQVLYAVAFCYRHGDRLVWSVGLPFLYNDLVPLHIKFVKLTVTEHHRVRGDWDDKIAYDGYKLVDDSGQEYTNQYPRASYGQISDEADRVFVLKIDESFPDDKPFDFYSATSRWWSFEQGLGSDKVDADFKSTKLRPLRDRFLKEFEEAFPGKTLSDEPVFGDRHPDIRCGIVIDKPTASA